MCTSICIYLSIYICIDLKLKRLGAVLHFEALLPERFGLVAWVEDGSVIASIHAVASSDLCKDSNRAHNITVI